MDVVDKKTRSRMMSGIKSKNTKPELLIRRSLHNKGIRYRLHVKNLPGKPDLVLKKYNAVIFIHGCFWHKHDCHLFKWPKSRTEFWQDKILSNKNRDRIVIEQLVEMDWRICVVWECALKGKHKIDLALITEKIIVWLKNNNEKLEIFGCH